MIEITQLKIDLGGENYQNTQTFFFNCNSTQILFRNTAIWPGFGGQHFVHLDNVHLIDVHIYRRGILNFDNMLGLY